MPFGAVCTHGLTRPARCRRKIRGARCAPDDDILSSVQGAAGARSLGARGLRPRRGIARMTTRSAAFGFGLVMAHSSPPIIHCAPPSRPQRVSLLNSRFLAPLTGYSVPYWPPWRRRRSRRRAEFRRVEKPGRHFAQLRAILGHAFAVMFLMALLLLELRLVTEFVRACVRLLPVWHAWSRWQ